MVYLVGIEVVRKAHIFLDLWLYFHCKLDCLLVTHLFSCLHMFCEMFLFYTAQKFFTGNIAFRKYKKNIRQKIFLWYTSKRAFQKFFFLSNLFEKDCRVDDSESNGPNFRSQGPLVCFWQRSKVPKFRVTDLVTHLQQE